jgi:hypothetical protein
MERFIKSIDRQIEFNRGKNIFFGIPGTFWFTGDILDNISSIGESGVGHEDFLVAYAADRAMEEFCRINQYFSFKTSSRKELRQLYADLFLRFRKGTGATEEIAENHYRNLKDWLKKYNPFAEQLYIHAGIDLEPVACSEYSPELQIDIFHLDVDKLLQPVLDIGCGMQGNLVKALNNRGVEAYGMDRFAFSFEFLFTSDWLEFDYGTKKWGTIISNLGFSNHFRHHNLREDGDYVEYARTYMSILHALKIGGSFYYAPDLPFIEQYLDKNQFKLAANKIDGCKYTAATIQRLK